MNVETCKHGYSTFSFHIGLTLTCHLPSIGTVYPCDMAADAPPAMKKRGSDALLLLLFLPLTGFALVVGTLILSSLSSTIIVARFGGGSDIASSPSAMDGVVADVADATSGAACAASEPVVNIGREISENKEAALATNSLLQYASDIPVPLYAIPSGWFLINLASSALVCTLCASFTPTRYCLPFNRTTSVAPSGPLCLCTEKEPTVPGQNISIIARAHPIPVCGYRLITCSIEYTGFGALLLVVSTVKNEAISRENLQLGEVQWRSVENIAESSYP